MILAYLCHLALARQYLHNTTKNYFENISPRIKPEKKETVSVTLQKFNEFSSLPPNEKTTHLEQLVSKTITHFKIKKINQPENSAELIIYTQPL